jgi:DNA-binding response OmpR family regulator
MSETTDTSTTPYLLLVEDNPGDVMLVRHILQPLPYRLQVLSDAETALAYLRSVGAALLPCPAAVLLDLNLPLQDGFDVLAAFPGLSLSCPVLVLTSSHRTEDRARTVALGAAGYFIKPADFDEYHRLRDVVLQLLGTPSTPVAPSTHPPSVPGVSIVD